MAQLTIDMRIPGDGTLAGLVLAVASAWRHLGLSAEGTASPIGLDVMVASDFVELARPLVRRSPLGVEAAELEPRWILGACLLLLHQRIEPDMLPNSLGACRTADVLAAASHLARVVPGFEDAGPLLAQLKSSFKT